MIRLVLAALLLFVCGPTRAEAAGHINLAIISGSINPASANYLIETIARSERDGALAVLIELDTPGGLVSSTKDIMQAILNSQVPVIVYVAPRGAWASSAGTFITVAAHIAAMAPGTTIGAAHPVSLLPSGGGGGGGEGGEGDAEGARDIAGEKAENLLSAYLESVAKERKRNVEWVVSSIRDSVAIGEDEALELGVIDLVAEDRDELLAALEGRTVEVAGKERTLALANARVEELKMTLLQRIFDVVADPNIAWLLMMGVALGFYIEFNSPGLILPGAAGGVCLVLLLISLQVLPFDWVGLLLILVGMGLLIAELFFTSLGTLFAGGVVCILLGGTMIFDRPDLSDLTISFWEVLVPSVVGLAFFGGFVVIALGRSLWVRQTAGVDELIGLVGRAASPIAPDGKVFVRGEYWNASSLDRIEQGDAVEITEVEGLRLNVRRRA